MAARIEKEWAAFLKRPPTKQTLDRATGRLVPHVDRDIEAADLDSSVQGLDALLSQKLDRPV